MTTNRPTADPRRRLGALGERLAAAYLTRRGFRLIEAGWRCRHGELDLIMRDGSTLVLVEVRTRRSPTHGTPQESITRRKRERLALLSQAYLQELARGGRPWSGPLRIDVVSITLSRRPALTSIQHIRSAVEALGG